MYVELIFSIMKESYTFIQDMWCVVIKYYIIALHWLNVNKLINMYFCIFADPSLPEKCPFQSAYHFTYNNNSGGFCNDPKSYVKPCASESKFSFQFKQCENVFDSNERGNLNTYLFEKYKVFKNVIIHRYMTRL